MSYINEIVSQQDIDQYGLLEIHRKYNRGDYQYEWTFDRSTGSFLIYLGYNHQEPSQERFIFSWHGHNEVLIMQSELLPEENGVKVVEWAPVRLAVDGTFPVPAELAGDSKAFVEALKEAFSAYQVAGLHSSGQDVVAFKF